MIDNGIDNLGAKITSRLLITRVYLSDPALDCITCGFLQGLYDILKQQKLGYAGAYLLRVGEKWLDRYNWYFCKIWGIIFVTVLT